jgi:hypothetical protein
VTGAKAARGGSAGGCGGSLARAMLTRQPDCETEIVPSLHSNLGETSASGAGLAGTAAVC